MISGYIDRMEEDVAVILLEDGDYHVNFPRDLLPEGIGEGHYITLTIAKDEAKQDEALAEVLALMED